MNRRVITIAATAAALVAVSSPVASAAPANTLDASGCNHMVCIGVIGNAGGFWAGAEERHANPTAGKIHLWGPGLDIWSADDEIPLAEGHGRGTGQACAEFWHFVHAGYYTSRGLACEDVT